MEHKSTPAERYRKGKDYWRSKCGRMGLALDAANAHVARLQETKERMQKMEHNLHLEVGELKQEIAHLRSGRFFLYCVSIFGIIASLALSAFILIQSAH